MVGNYKNIEQAINQLNKINNKMLKNNPDMDCTLKIYWETLLERTSGIWAWNDANVLYVKLKDVCEHDVEYAQSFVRGLKRFLKNDREADGHDTTRLWIDPQIPDTKYIAIEYDNSDEALQDLTNYINNH